MVLSLNYEHCVKIHSHCCPVQIHTGFPVHPKGGYGGNPHDAALANVGASNSAIVRIIVFIGGSPLFND